MNNLKKTISIISLSLLFFIIYFLQANFFSWFNIAGIKPNLFVLLMLIMGLFMGKKTSIVLAIILGFILDMLTGKIIGASSIMFVIIIIIANIYDKNFSKDNRMTIMVMGASQVAIFEMGFYIINIINLSAPIEIFGFLKILCIEVLFNTLITIILYPLIQKFGEYLEETFKGQKILTRYF